MSHSSRQGGVKLAPTRQSHAFSGGGDMNEVGKVFAWRFGKAASSAPEVVPRVEHVRVEGRRGSNGRFEFRSQFLPFG